MTSVCDTCKRDKCRVRMDGLKMCDMRVCETNYEKLFSTPEKAAWTLANACAKCSDKFPCWECPLTEISGSNVYEPELLEWLESEVRDD